MVLTKPTLPNLAPRALREAMGLSRERMARLFDVSAKTIERWEARSEPPSNPIARQRLAQLQEIVNLGLMVFKPDGFHLFLTTPMPVFGGRTGLQLIQDGQGDEVFGELAGIYEGLGF